METAKGLSGQAGQPIGILEAMALEPARIGAQHHPEVVKLGGQMRCHAGLFGQLHQLRRRHLVTLQFAQDEAQLSGQARKASRGVKSG